MTTGAAGGAHTIHVALPFHLRNLAGVGPEVELGVHAPVTIGTCA